MISILETPPALNLLTASTQSSAEEAGLTPKKGSRSRAQSQSSASAKVTAQNSQDAADEPDKTQTEDSKQEPELTEQDKRVKQYYEDYYEVVKAHQDDDVKTLLKVDDTNVAVRAMTPLRELFNDPISRSDLNKLKHVKCVESIEYSASFNPVSETRKMAGDLFYLTVRTLENPSIEHCITCCVNGFYKNDSTERLTFNPAPSTRGNPCYSYTLAGCLNQLSP